MEKSNNQTKKEKIIFFYRISYHSPSAQEHPAGTHKNRENALAAKQI
ncbi:MAG: hypothetical protein IJX45_08120 [Spirochaetaceae bacterium]|nr:hypothetical protein [Spirochaetaceae bacterium]MBQ8385181.1 hypothetical protein [Spirochaetaceae bacterium]